MKWKRESRGRKQEAKKDEGRGKEGGRREEVGAENDTSCVCLKKLSERSLSVAVHCVPYYGPHWVSSRSHKDAVKLQLRPSRQAATLM